MSNFAPKALTPPGSFRFKLWGAGGVFAGVVLLIAGGVAFVASGSDPGRQAFAAGLAGFWIVVSVIINAATDDIDKESARYEHLRIAMHASGIAGSVWAATFGVAYLLMP